MAACFSYHIDIVQKHVCLLFSLLCPPTPITRQWYMYLLLKTDTFTLVSGPAGCLSIIARITLSLHFLYMIDVFRIQKMSYLDVNKK